MRRLSILCAVALATLIAAPAQAAVLDPADAAELANSLAEATAEQKVCYGWSFEVSDFASGAEDGPEVGSNLGPGQPAAPTEGTCAHYVVLSGGITYTSETSEEEDSAFWSIESNLPDPPRVAQLEALGYSEDDLLGDDNDLAIINATGALPELVAEKGVAKAVPFQTARRAPGVSGEPTGDQGSDFIRENGSLLALCAVLFLGGLIWFIWLTLQGRRARPPHRPAEN